LRYQAGCRRQKDEKNGCYKTQHQAVSMLDPGDKADIEGPFGAAG
jgi:hypothetical protein